MSTIGSARCCSLSRSQARSGGRYFHPTEERRGIYRWPVCFTSWPPILYLTMTVFLTTVGRLTMTAGRRRTIVVTVF